MYVNMSNCLWTIIKTVSHEFITTKNFNSVSYWPSLCYSFSISCTWMQAHTWTHMCMWRPEFDVKNHPRPSFYLFTEAGTLSQTQSSLTMTSLDNQLARDQLPLPSKARTTGGLLGSPGIYGGSRALNSGKCFSHWAIFLVPMPFLNWKIKGDIFFYAGLNLLKNNPAPKFCLLGNSYHLSLYSVIFHFVLSPRGCNNQTWHLPRPRLHPTPIPRTLLVKGHASQRWTSVPAAPSIPASVPVHSPARYTFTKHTEFCISLHKFPQIFLPMVFWTEVNISMTDANLIDGS